MKDKKGDKPWVLGVFYRIGQSLGFNPLILRIIFLAVVLFVHSGVLVLYIILAILMPKDLGIKKTPDEIDSRKGE